MGLADGGGGRGWDLPSEQGWASRGAHPVPGVSGGGDSTGLTCSPNELCHKLPQAAIHDRHISTTGTTS